MIFNSILPVEMESVFSTGNGLSSSSGSMEGIILWIISRVFSSASTNSSFVLSDFWNSHIPVSFITRVAQGKTDIMIEVPG